MPCSLQTEPPAKPQLVLTSVFLRIKQNVIFTSSCFKAQECVCVYNCLCVGGGVHQCSRTVIAARLYHISSLHTHTHRVRRVVLRMFAAHPSLHVLYISALLDPFRRSLKGATFWPSINSISTAKSRTGNHSTKDNTEYRHYFN